MRPWSYSRLSCYEECPRKYQYSYVEKVPSSRPDSPAAGRGTDIHDKGEKYLKGDLKIYPPEFQKVSAHTMLLKRMGMKPEVKLAVSEDWSPRGWDDADVYMRAIIDILGMEETILHIQDWKTGQVYDSHPKQMETYVAIAASHFPEATEYRTRLIYIDQGMVTPPKVTPTERLKGIRLMLSGRIKNAEEDTIFPVRPGMGCRWCDYSKKYGGPCAH